MKARVVLLFLAAVSSGCATKHPPMQPITTTQVVGVPTSDVVLIAPKMVADETPGGLFGDEITPEGRSSAKEAWAQQMSRRADVTGSQVGQVVGHCLAAGIVYPVVGLLMCPLMLVGGAVVTVGARGIAHAKGSATDSALLLPEASAALLAAAYQDRATSAALAERALRTAGLEPSSGAVGARDQILIRMQSMEVAQTQTRWLVVRISAAAQGFSSTGAQFTPTEHIFEWSYRLRPRQKRWGAEDDEVLDQVLDQALDALARSIASTYGF